MNKVGYILKSYHILGVFLGFFRLPNYLQSYTQNDHECCQAVLGFLTWLK